MNKDEIIELIKQTVQHLFGTRMVGDTPTDANQLTPKKYVDANKVNAGLVISDGTAGTPMPTGWTTSRTAAGRYLVTHNLGTTSYVPITTADQSNVCVPVTRDANSFNVYCYSIATAAFNDSDFYFLLK